MSTAPMTRPSSSPRPPAPVPARARCARAAGRRPGRGCRAGPRPRRRRRPHRGRGGGRSRPGPRYRLRGGAQGAGRDRLHDPQVFAGIAEGTGRPGRSSSTANASLSPSTARTTSRVSAGVSGGALGVRAPATGRLLSSVPQGLDAAAPPLLRRTRTLRRTHPDRMRNAAGASCGFPHSVAGTGADPIRLPSALVRFRRLPPAPLRRRAAVFPDRASQARPSPAWRSSR
jgi:hypothetical protein